jgi:hypothetical protein
VIGNQHGPALDQTPHGPAVGKLALLPIKALRKYVFFPLALRQFIGRLEPPAAPWFLLLGLPSPSGLPLLFGFHGKRFVDFRRGGRLFSQFVKGRFAARRGSSPLPTFVGWACPEPRSPAFPPRWEIRRCRRLAAAGR